MLPQQAWPELQHTPLLLQHVWFLPQHLLPQQAWPAPQQVKPTVVLPQHVWPELQHTALLPVPHFRPEGQQTPLEHVEPTAQQ